MLVEIQHLTATQRYTVRINGRLLEGVTSVHLSKGLCELLVERDGSVVRRLGPESDEARQAVKAGRGNMDEFGLVTVAAAPKPPTPPAKAEVKPLHSTLQADIASLFDAAR
jgi:hypothetical protein